jgi:hypothetical protein
LQEVRRLERLRTKRAFEATLPPIDDVARLPERQAMIEAWEVQEWVEREEEIKSVQEERLALLAQALQASKLGLQQLLQSFVRKYYRVCCWCCWPKAGNPDTACRLCQASVWHDAMPSFTN